jgi:hypothetical protein
MLSIALPQQIIPPEDSDPERTELTFEVPAEGTDAANFR